MIRHKGHILEFIGEYYRFQQRMHMEEQQSGERKIETGFAFRVDLLHPRKERVLCSVAS